MRRPSVRAAYDALEHEVEPRLEALVRTAGFAQASALVADIRSSVGTSVDSWIARVLHAVNLPAGTDVQRLGRRIGELDREVRLLRLELAQYAEERGDVRPDGG